MEDGDLGPVAYGVVVEGDRGSLPFALLHGEPLVVWAARALGAAGVQLLDLTTPWEDVRDAGMPLVWHDALCPLTPPDFVADCVRRAVADDVVVAGVLPVTDTVKEIVRTADGPVVGATHDREQLRRLVSPLVLPGGVVARLPGWPPTGFPAALSALRAVHDVALVTAPEVARRVRTADEVGLLEALSRP
jgi:2-C-methyl-D-erythritol 4-phosphate cytidylyltransferase